MHARLLIVGTVPYNRQSTARAFDAYFHNWEKENIAQVFSNNAVPPKGHCGTLYQITDERLVKKWCGKIKDPGIIYNYDILPDETNFQKAEANSQGLMSQLYKIGRSHTPFTHLMRKVLWRKKYWNTPQFNKWLDDFRPECVFLSFSNDFFILEIALYVAQKYNIPICSSTGDDYYFNTKITIDPLFYIYHAMYKKLNREVFRHKGSAIYISDKIRDKYNGEFGLDGETVYLVSDIQRKAFHPIDPKNVKISYFGNIKMGRNESLYDIGTALGHIDPKLKLKVYSNEVDKSVYGIFEDNPNVQFMGSVPYSEVMRLSSESDILVIVEGFKKSDVIVTRYSLSTKVADALASGCNILVYGSAECGAMEYMKRVQCATVCHSISELEEGVSRLLHDVELQKHNYETAGVISKKNHTLEQSTATVERIIQRLVEQNN